MMVELCFEPLLSFTATCRWQLLDTPLPAARFDDDEITRPFWVEFDDWNGDDGWLMTSLDYGEEMLQSFLIDSLWGREDRQRAFCDSFWFGVYRLATGFVYEIRPAYEGNNLDRWPSLEYWLDVSRNGYLGFYPARSDAGVCKDDPASLVLRDPFGTSVVLPADPPIDLETALYKLTAGRRTPLWYIPGLDPQRLQEGQLLLNMKLYSADGRQVRRRVERVAYLNNRQGARGQFSLQVSNPCVPPHPRPLVATP
ncbi:hypothetical protein [Pseudomonas sp. GD03746]|uniref:hypothetical protein n=1 Tax=Pseudomonas sp. GD03746 TaxID=2975378 RepID=UPI00244820A8|nr:hypothetical protein [Pseudomonas sp. GD03746]MDH1571608.1 hypothetical protein [Pseudomonas sp. GD03746]HEN8713797.1 hypothetical protein [Pseudomonas putida]HEN8718924.1 hypothetical protein [Pseudomonas putida]